MNILGVFVLLQLLSPSHDVIQAGVWAHYGDTLVITNNSAYITNADAISYMCGRLGKIENNCLKGSCGSEGARMNLRSTDMIDTLFIITTGLVWTPYTRVPITIDSNPETKHDTIKSEKPVDRKYW
jgi:hypothetical protein